jgi:hypothetical protein
MAGFQVDIKEDNLILSTNQLLMSLVVLFVQRQRGKDGKMSQLALLQL